MFFIILFAANGRAKYDMMNESIEATERLGRLIQADLIPQMRFF